MIEVSTSGILALSVAVFSAAVSAHGHVSGITANGKYYMGYTPNIQYMNPKPKLPAWSAGGYGQGGIVAQNYANPNAIVCHDNPKPGEGIAEIAAGTPLKIHWTEWATSHHGPILTYLAPCPNNNCLSPSLPPKSLLFTKIAETGLVTPGGPNAYSWATDQLKKSNNTWTVTIPKSLKDGQYVLRNEIIALHTAGTVGGAQNYPQCFNIKVTGGGNAVLPKGVPATQFYKPAENGIVFNIAANVQTYPLPGPKIQAVNAAGPASS